MIDEILEFLKDLIKYFDTLSKETEDIKEREQAIYAVAMLKTTYGMINELHNITSALKRAVEL